MINALLSSYIQSQKLDKILVACPFLTRSYLFFFLSKRFPDAQIVVKEHPDMFDPNFNGLPYDKSNKYQYLREGL